MDDIKVEKYAAASPAVSVCPYLSLRDDPSTAMAYPSGGNTCRLEGSPRRISRELQAGYCLREGHPACLEVRGQEVRHAKAPLGWSGQLSIAWAVMILAGLLGIGGILWWFGSSIVW